MNIVRYLHSALHNERKHSYEPFGPCSIINTIQFTRHAIRNGKKLEKIVCHVLKCTAAKNYQN